MSFSRMFPRALAVCFAVGLSALTAAAQTATRPRAVGEPAATTSVTTRPDGRASLENELRVISTADEAEAEPAEDVSAPTLVRGMGSISNVSCVGTSEHAARTTSRCARRYTLPA